MLKPMGMIGGTLLADAGDGLFKDSINNDLWAGIHRVVDTTG